MHTHPKFRPITRSLPFVLAMIAIACSANDESRPPPAQSSGAQVPERADGSASPADASTAGKGTIDEQPVDDQAGNGEPRASDAADGAIADVDSDGDGLPDSVETNTHVFVSRTDTGTDPKNWDSDADGIADGDEVLGTAAGLNLPAMGTNPLRKNILIEYDWFEDGNECAAHSHRPTAATVKVVSATFAGSPVRNPDGSTGVTVIHDYGQGGAFSGGNRIADSDGVIDGGVSDSDFANYRANNFAANRQGYFHYALLPHRYGTNSESSGQAHIVGDNLIVSLYCQNTDYNVAATIVHELGHNLGLRHGGNVDTNYKPNYNSVMNYMYQFNGVDTDCTPPGNGVIDYSRNQRISLDENALDERKGTCGATAWDWNGNGSIESRISLDINRDSTLAVLTDYDDWAAIVYDWHGRPGALARRDVTSAEIATCDSRPPGY
jgi:hypothetical protein